MKVYNPILKFINEKNKDKIFKYTETYSDSILDQKALEILKKYSPIIEIGAGFGYNSYLLNVIGVKVESFDKEIYNGEYFYPVKKGTHLQIRNYPTYNLFISWPSSNNEMGYNSLRQFIKNSNAKYFIFVGEYRKNENALYGNYRVGTKKFFNFLDDNFKLIKTVSIPNWKITKSKLYIYKIKYPRK